MTSEWEREDLSMYNNAERPWYSIDRNGKVDIGNKYRDNEKIGLDKSGMIKFIKDWLMEVDKHQIHKEEREELIKLLSE